MHDKNPSSSRGGSNAWANSKMRGHNACKSKSTRAEYDRKEYIRSNETLAAVRFWKKNMNLLETRVGGGAEGMSNDAHCDARIACRIDAVIKKTQRTSSIQTNMAARATMFEEPQWEQTSSPRRAENHLPAQWRRQTLQTGRAALDVSLFSCCLPRLQVQVRTQAAFFTHARSLTPASSSLTYVWTQRGR